MQANWGPSETGAPLRINGLIREEDQEDVHLLIALNYYSMLNYIMNCWKPNDIYIV